MLLTRMKKVLSLNLAMLLAGLALLSVLSIASPTTQHASAESQWTFCATEATNCIFTGTKNVRYGATVNGVDQFVTELKEAKSFMGISCLTSEFGGFDPAPGKPKSCYVSNLTQDQMWSVSTNEGNNSIVIPFLVNFALAGTLEDLKNKIWIKRTDVPGFTALGPEDTVGLTRTGGLYNGKSTLTIGLSKPLTGSDNELIIGAGAFFNYAQDIVINELKEKDAGSWQLLGDQFSPGRSFKMSLAVFHGTPYLAYVDQTLGSLFVKKYVQGAWVDTGGGAWTGIFPTLVAEGDNLYVSYMDGGGFVKKYDETGNVWSTVGGGVVSSGVLSMTVAKGIPYVAYREGGNGKLTVKKYKESIDGWETLGTVGFSDTAVTEISLSVLDGIPYVAYRSESMEWVQYEGYMLTYTGGWVKKFDETSNSWQDMGKFADNNLLKPLLYMEGGIPHVLFVDLSHVAVGMKKYTGSSWRPWEPTGNPDSLRGAFSFDATSFFISDGILYSASDQADGTAAVKRYNGSNWIPMGSLGVSGALSLFVDQGVLYAANSENLGFIGYKPMIRRFLLTPPALTADTTINDTLSPIEVTFPESSAWRNEIVAVKDGTTTLQPGMDYVVTAGKITFHPGVLAVGDHTITVSTRHYADATANQRVFLRSPTLTADATVNYVVNAIEVTFPEDAAWSGAITAVKDGTTALQRGTDYVVSAGKITINPGVLAEGSHRITVTATDYLDASVDQTVTWIPSPSLSADATDNDPSTEIEVTFADDEAWRDEITAVKDGTKTLALSKYSVNAGKITFKAGALALGTHTIKVVAPNYADATVVQTVADRVVPVSNDALLSGLTVDQGALTFVPTELNYSVDVPNNATSLHITVVLGHADQTLSVTGATYSSIDNGVYHYDISGLEVGATVISIDVTAQDGLTMNPYRLTIHRAALASDDSNLSGLSLSSGALSPGFTPDTTVYTAGVDYDVSSLTVTASAEDGNATLSVHGNPAISDEASGPISLNVGPNPIAIIVTAEDGSAQTYTVTVTRNAQASGGSGNSSGSGSGGGGVSGPTVPIAPPATTTSNDGQLTLPQGTSGEVSLNNEVTVTIPADASEQELKVTIDKVLDSQSLLTNNEVVVSPIFEILKNFEHNFDHPVTLTFAFDPAGLKSGETVAVFYYDETKKEWVKVGGVVNGNEIVVDVDHFTKYAVFAVSPTAEEPSTGTQPNFGDIAGHWAEASIKQAVESRIASGYPDGTFKPNRTVTRAEFAVMLVNALKLQSEEAQLTFADAANIGAWAKKAVALAVKAGILKGYADGSFRPDAEITRAEMAAMIAGALNLSIDANAATGFADDEQIPAWAKGAVDAIQKHGLVKGKSSGEFDPLGKTTRAEAVTVLLHMVR
ncbi:S-layer homology domain-containing protein [Cohnella suwonensis]|uniref:S-layer homology domain-containing protein n=1 Tax=Cohnella suwonensis TaxID=696072 RepID=A0ABW0LTE9_9BACL